MRIIIPMKISKLQGYTEIYSIRQHIRTIVSFFY
jgi:hypothetical protein